MVSGLSAFIGGCIFEWMQAAVVSGIGRSWKKLSVSEIFGNFFLPAVPELRPGACFVGLHFGNL